MKLRPAASTTASPVAPELMEAPLAIETSEPAPVAVMKIAPVEAMEPIESDCELLSVNAPTTPLVVTAPTALAPVRLTFPFPLSASVAAVNTPDPFSVAPDPTTVVSVPVPTFRLPERVNAPELTVVVPL